MKGPLWRLARAAWGREGSEPSPVLAAVLGPFSWAFAALSRLRGRHYDRVGGRRVPGIAVVSVGNLAVGGTGKTPLAAWIARALAERGARPAVVLRGYGRDEVALHRSWNPSLPVVVAPDRVRGVRTAREAGADVAVLDDGFQHRRLARDLDLVLLAVEDPVPVRLLPAGPYREPWPALGRADAVVLTRRVATVEDSRRRSDAVEREVAGVVAGCVRIGTKSWTDLNGAPVDPPRGPALVVAAVARPEAFRLEVERVAGARAELVAFPDHHELGPADVRRIARRAAGRPVVVTEKDAVKLRAAASPSSARRRTPSSRGAPAAGARLERVLVAVEGLHWDWGEERVLGLLGRLGGPPGERPAGAAARAHGGPS